MLDTPSSIEYSRGICGNFGPQAGTTPLMTLTRDLYEMRSLAPKLPVNLDRTQRTSEQVQRLN